MKTVIGLVLIVFGVLAGAATPFQYRQAEAEGVGQSELLGRAIGGALLAVLGVGLGFLLMRSADKKAHPGHA